MVREERPIANAAGLGSGSDCFSIVERGKARTAR